MTELQIPTLWTAKATAKALAISERKLWTMTQAGEIPHVRFGRAVRYDPADVAAFVQGRKLAART